MARFAPYDGSSPLYAQSLRCVTFRLAAYNGWPALRLADDIVVADRGPWLEFLRDTTHEKLLYAFRVLRALTRLVDAPRAIRALLDGEVAGTPGRAPSTITARRL